MINRLISVRHLRYLMASAALTLWSSFLFVPPGVFAQGTISSTTSAAITSSSSVTAPVSSTSVSQPVVERDVYGDMLDHFKTVTEISFGLVTTVVAILGAIGVIAAYFSFKTVRELEAFARKSQSDLESLKAEFVKLKLEAETNISQGKKDLEVSNRTIQRLWLLTEARDQNPQIRIRAIQQFGEIDDMISVSVLIEALANDEDISVQMQAAAGLGRRLKNDGSQGEMLIQGISVLHEKLDTDNTNLKLTVITAFKALVNRGVVLLQPFVVTLRNIARTAEDSEVAKSAQEVLRAIDRKSTSTALSDTAASE